MTEKVAILEAGGQYAKVIDRRVRELFVNTEIIPLSTPSDVLSKYKALIISGGPDSVNDKITKYDKKIFELGIPVLGICFGMQLMAFCSGGKILRKDEREDGQFRIKVEIDCPLFADMKEEQKVLLTHGDSVIELGDGYRIIARSGDIISGIGCEEKKLYGVQFHPEVDLTENGIHIFKNFLFKIAGCSGNFTMDDRHLQAIKYIQSRVGSKKVLVLASGGVDSTVCTALLNEALGKDKVIPLHINNGFMRKDESKKVGKALENIGANLLNIDASEDFYNGTTEILIEGKKITTKKLKETVHPEEKRKIIGDMFMKIAQREISKLGLGVDEVYLAQGTLRPDIIESGSPDISKVAQTIKTHHNDTNLVRELRLLGRVVEPLSEYHKDEVRKLGRSLGLTDSIVMRQPFPGPGLAVRIICTEAPFMDDNFVPTNNFLETLVCLRKEGTENVDINRNLKDYEKSILEEIRTNNHIRATLLPFKTVGVQGDGRTYNYACALSSNTNPNWEHLFMLARLIPRLRHNINRVVYVYGPRLEEHVTYVTPTTMTNDIIQFIQEADDIATEILTSSGSLLKISQAPIILFPVPFDKPGATHSIAIRTIITNDFMTGQPAVPNQDIDPEVLSHLVKTLTEALPRVGRVVYDLTSKPPGTTEWE